MGGGVDGGEGMGGGTGRPTATKGKTLAAQADSSEQEARTVWLLASASDGTENHVSKWPAPSRDASNRDGASSQDSSTVREWLAQLNCRPTTCTGSPGCPRVGSSDIDAGPVP